MNISYAVSSLYKSRSCMRLNYGGTLDYVFVSSSSFFIFHHLAMMTMPTRIYASQLCLLQVPLLAVCFYHALQHTSSSMHVIDAFGCRPWLFSLLHICIITWKAAVHYGKWTNVLLTGVPKIHDVEAVFATATSAVLKLFNFKTCISTNCWTALLRYIAKLQVCTRRYHWGLGARNQPFETSQKYPIRYDTIVGI